VSVCSILLQKTATIRRITVGVQLFQVKGFEFISMNRFSSSSGVDEQMMCLAKAIGMLAGWNLMYAEEVSFDILRLKRVSHCILSCMLLMRATRGINNPWSAMRIRGNSPDFAHVELNMQCLHTPHIQRYYISKPVVFRLTRDA
jgi:hypothetical protein